MIKAGLVATICVMTLGCQPPRVEPPAPVRVDGGPRLFRNRSMPTDPRLEKYPFAEAVPDRPGFVVSPYSGRVLDVRSVREGGLASDPSIPWSKRYFRIRSSRAQNYGF